MIFRKGRGRRKKEQQLQNGTKIEEIDHFKLFYIRYKEIMVQIDILRRLIYKKPMHAMKQIWDIRLRKFAEL